MASDSSDVYASLVELLKEGVVGPTVTYADVAACSLFIWDYILTLDLEIKLIWRAKWNLIKAIYLIQRYLPFIDSCYLSLYRQLAFHLTLEQCERLPFVIGFLYLAGIIFSEILLGLRVWAVWNRSKALAIALPVAFILIFGGACVATYYYLHSLKYAVDVFPGVDMPGCFVIAANDTAIWSWAGLIVWNFITLVLILIPGYYDYRAGVNSRLGSLIYRDGTYYYIYLFVFSALNIAFTLTLPPAKRVIVTSLERCLHSVLASRVLLHMRAEVHDDPNKWKVESMQQEHSATATIGVSIATGTDQGGRLSLGNVDSKPPIQSYTMGAVT